MLGVLVWRLPDVRLADLGPRWTSTSVWWMIGSAVTMTLAFALSTERWIRVLAAMCPSPPFRRMFSHFLAGQFVSNVLPTAFGGDVVRIARLGRDIDDAPRAFASVTIERLTGWLVLPAITLISLAVQPRLADLGVRIEYNTKVSDLQATMNEGGYDAALVALGAILALAANRRFTADLDEMVGWRRFLVAVHLGVDALRRAPASAAAVLSVGAAFQIAQCAAVWMAARAIGVPQVTLGVALAFFPAAAIAQNLPIGFGGLGVREGIFVVFFGAVGASKGLAITLGLVVYGLTIITSALGAPAFATGFRPDATRRPPAS